MSELREYERGMRDMRAAIERRLSRLVAPMWVTQLDGKSPETTARTQVLGLALKAVREANPADSFTE